MAHKQHRHGFTLMELLVSVGVVGTLSTIAISAVNPTKQLTVTADAKRSQRVNQIQKAFEEFIVDQESNPGDASISVGIANADDICRNGIIDASCINIDELVPTYIPCIPYDAAETDSNLTGFQVYLSNDRPQIVSVYKDTNSAATGGGCDSAPNPLGLWAMNETTVGATLVDASGNSFSGTPANMASPEGPSTDTPSTITFRNARSLQYDGSDDYVSVTYDSDFDLTTGLSIAAWIKLESFGSSDDVDIIMRKGEGNPNTWQLAIEDQRLTMMLDQYDGVNGRAQGSTTLSADTWYHVAGTWDGTTVTVYVNGVVDDTGTHSSALSTDSRNIYIGGRSGTDLIDGYLDDVRIYSEALGPGDVRALAVGYEL